MASHFVWLNRSKESLTLDLKRPEAARVLERLLEGADVFLQNLAPGAIDRLGLGADALRQRYPRLIVCNLSGYGTSGPYADKKAYDLIIQSEVGMLSVTGTEATPCKVGVSIADISAGMYAYSGILTALLARKDTGEGTVAGRRADRHARRVDGLCRLLHGVRRNAAAAHRRQSRHHCALRPVSHVRRLDHRGRAQQPRVGGSSARACLQQPALAEDPRFQTNVLRVQHRDALTAAIEARAHAPAFRRSAATARGREHRERHGQYDARVSGSTRSWPRAIAGARWIRRRARYARSFRRSACSTSSRRWAPFRRSGSTAGPSSKSWSSTQTTIARLGGDRSDLSTHRGRIVQSSRPA